jgi:hypothetical protein
LKVKKKKKTQSMSAADVRSAAAASAPSALPECSRILVWDENGRVLFSTFDVSVFFLFVARALSERNGRHRREQKPFSPPPPSRHSFCGCGNPVLWSLWSRA